MNKQDINRILARGRSETCGLDSEIRVKEGARVMLTTNINIQDRLINGQMGTVFTISYCSFVGMYCSQSSGSYS